MAYSRSPSNNFAEHQIKEGFGSAVGLSAAEAAKIADNGSDELPAGLQGYENYPTGGVYDMFEGKTVTQDNKEFYEIAKRSVGFGNVIGLGNDEDDAFSGYSLGSEVAPSLLTRVQDSAIDEDEDEDEEDEGFDGYDFAGSEGSLQSWHTFFNKASLARTSTGLIKNLGLAVQAVSDDTAVETKQEYFNMASNLLQKRKQEDLHHLDLKTAELNSNIGWLINSTLPKKGGFNAIVNKTVGSIGAKLAKGQKDDLRNRHKMDLGLKLKAAVASSLGELGEGNKLPLIIGAGVLGLTLACYLYNRKANVAAAAKSKARSARRRKRRRNK